MATAGYNEADTRSKLIDPALHARQWVERVLAEQQTSHGEIHREQSGQRIDILDGKPLRRGKGRVELRSKAHQDFAEVFGRKTRTAASSTPHAK